MKLADLRTPALILDRGKLARNLARMHARAAALKVALRPHLKTAKCAEVAQLATAGQAGGITVSTLAEAEFFAARGFTDITYGVGITPDKLAEVAKLQQAGARIGLLTDDLGAAQALAGRAAGLPGRFRFHIEVDCGQHRAGVAPDSAGLLGIAAALTASANIELAGVLTHAGHSYSCRSVAEIRALAETERAAAVAAAGRLRAAGHACPVVSVGSSPTALFAEDLTGVSEMRPGVFMFQDLFQHRLGCCEEDDIAVSVLASVVGGRQDRRVLIDAGALALSQDASVPGPDGKTRYGKLRGADGQAALDGWAITAVNQEHGFATGTEAGAAAGLPVGSRVRVLPNHACMMAAMYDRYHVVDGSDDILAVWPRAQYW